ncbi:CBN-CLEC-197 protein [Caenorhabditis brenneri]|uniref:CBN-CLEC-197 protein n=1 Tax=Caenorhabditis brenneri TaxID=135651 RepID=G0MRI5_CAEBE|nr:CBN-CLEC-197 protein [Caenorhabditis brenneri]
MSRLFLILPVFFVAAHAMGVPIGDCNGVSQCPEGFKKFTQRSNGAWCMKVIPGNMTWWEAERECRCTTKGAHLSGVETVDELHWVEQQGQNVLEKGNVQDGSIWIGAYRRKECLSGAESTNSLCHAEKLFQFTDQHTCGTTIFQDWADNQPKSTAGEDCATILVSIEASGANLEASGKPASKNCLQTTGPTPIMSTIGYLCGVKPVSEENNYGGGYGGGNGGYGFGGEMIVIGAAKPDKKH